LVETADVDFVLYDMEHSGIEIDRIFDLIAWSKAAPFAPFVRVPQGMYHFLARVMDAGAMGVMVANVETPEQARSIVNTRRSASAVLRSESHIRITRCRMRPSTSATQTKARS
jgi:2-keto-3-deoxy-L-rhamnonate aldolase RhmA